MNIILVWRFFSKWTINKKKKTEINLERKFLIGSLWNSSNEMTTGFQCSDFNFAIVSFRWDGRIRSKIINSKIIMSKIIKLDILETKDRVLIVCSFSHLNCEFRFECYINAVIIVNIITIMLIFYLFDVFRFVRTSPLYFVHKSGRANK